MYKKLINKKKMKFAIKLLVPFLALICLYLLPVGVLATGLDSYLTRNVISVVNGEGSLRWVASSTAQGLFTIDRQGIPTSPISYDFGSLGVNTTKETGLAYFTVKNNASAAINIYIKGTDMVGGTAWALSDNAIPGFNIYGLKVGLSGDYTIVVKKNSPYNLLVSSLASGASQSWGLKIWAPTEFSDGVAKTCTVTLWVVLY